MTTILIDERTEDGKKVINFLRKKRFVQILDSNQEKDWWDIISDDEKTAIEEGLLDVRDGKVVSYDKIILKNSHRHFDRVKRVEKSPK